MHVQGSVKQILTKLFPCFKAIGTNYKTMKSLIKDLFFDKELVDSIRQTKIDKNILYQQLINGRITLKEYLAALAGNTSN